ncbi:MAG: hypothetical protein UY70_C0001G0021 [Candidatus Kaiserbacteria bacterium GW2011_GWB1_52_6]|uniref:Uncharacterized protein n=3 Tax=Candidatus Kaiseribacteriota TaxID=1752734 RepID=A0A0G2AF76_9BACT|nr:MAG: hypothetical protein UY67_C0007G0021 [Candidatus Kaiserbacteria bacterium GW2011_GWA2_52_12]KKW28185.1 MAG: hypothetical protein UY70_C0001G0021 [Candidatus Kaiserbacteria bacterium GW2011_GWB1_52_6]KKW31154.1 MAG: hypothetical protein UY74_C0022G0010 [Candidatus Kaiserbacteria bacterium GW2011_GWC2_52_8b]
MRISRILVLVGILLAPAAALAAAPRTFQDFANVLVTLMSSASIVLVVLGLVVYFYGVSTNIMSLHGGKAGAGEKIKAYFFWGVIVLFVMVSVWGILQLLKNTVFGGGTEGAPLPEQSLDFQQQQFIQ